MADCFRDANEAQKQLRGSGSGGRTDDAQGARRVGLSTRLAASIGKGLTARGPELGPLRASFLRMGWLQGTGSQSMKWALIAAGLLSTGCAGLIGAGTAVVVVGAGVLGFTCYDRVSVTVTDGLTGTKLCDAKVTFVQGTSETEATSCYQAALSSGAYTLRVERHGLVTFEQPINVSDDGACGQTVQTMYVALDRKNRVVPPQQIAPPPVTPPPAIAPPPGTAPSVAPPPAAAPPPASQSSAPQAPLPPAPPSQPAPPQPAPPQPAPTPPPASSAFPDTPR